MREVQDMGRFHQLTLEEPEKMYGWRKEKLAWREIGRRLKRHHSALIREWERHTKYGKAYLPCRAQKRAELWSERQRYVAPLKGPEIFLYVREHLREPYCWSPETIAGRLVIDHPGSTIDDETIYRYIYGKKQKRMKLWKYLIRHRKRRMKKDGRKVNAYARLATAIPIKDRPSVINERRRTKDWESDNMEGKKSDSTSVSVTVDRMSRITRIRKLADHTARTKSDVLIAQFKEDGAHSVTVDRGPENSDHERITKEIEALLVYGCEPYHSWEKGTVENTIGRIRWIIPKGTSVDGISQQQLTRIEQWMNNTPRKCLGFLTPNEFHEKIQTASHIP